MCNARKLTHDSAISATHIDQTTANMPHATETLANGEKHSSQFISHFTSLPAVNDSIGAFKSNPYGKKSLELVDGAYSRFGKPVEPYLQTPYSYAKPYVQKADELADSGLSWGENKFPIVKEETGTIVDTAKGYVLWPYSYVSQTWQDEYKKTASHNERGPGLTTSGLALISTELRIATDVFHTIVNFLGPKAQEGKKNASDYAHSIGEKAQDLKQNGEKKANDYAKVGQEKVNDYAKAGQEKMNEAKQYGEEKKEQGEQKAQKAKDEAGKKTQK
ncbi:uncharacterized protein RCC_00643 [Ramularia collo-cygni]|uniref:CAP20-virulence factor n=1 Tax=Ramularia collo-cygni TaxID=112498 RepID=A0A2D3UZM0_9PEZI|nr:uncharacterized protein RCC_00643 [Ramularia collo-cygni]CZT14669.1 uncharacterized protein RCC_00643 [Ramularia collo-cygni]